jgi:tRNA modification GTPase
VFWKKSPDQKDSHFCQLGVDARFGTMVPLVAKMNDSCPLNGNETIVAPSTPYGESGIAVVRLSGSLCRTLVTAALGRDDPTPRHAYYGPYTKLDGEIVDSVIYIYFESPRSYTGECMLEISAHGSPLAVQDIVRDLMERGARYAEPGEFTRRAFLNGKMDLCRAEAVADFIHAQSEQALRVAHGQLCGSFSRKLDDFVRHLTEIVAVVEAYLDFSDDDLPPEDRSALVGRLTRIEHDVERLLDCHRSLPGLKNGWLAVIVGAPNAGKSTLLNTLLGRERALVGPMPGTTRDFIGEWIRLGRQGWRLVDTAGVHDTTDVLEQRSIEKTREQVERAKLILWAIDRSRPCPPIPDWMRRSLRIDKTLVVLNKSDLEIDARSLPGEFHDFHQVEVSLLDDRDGPRLKKILGKIADAALGEIADVDVWVNDRHAEALRSTQMYVRTALSALGQNRYADGLANDLKCALAALETIVGRRDYESVLDEIFSRFCIGK